MYDNVDAPLFNTAPAHVVLSACPCHILFENASMKSHDHVVSLKRLEAVPEAMLTCAY